MKKQILVLMLVLCLVLPSILAFDYINSGFFGTYKLDSCINLKQTCSNCSYINITSIINPNSTQVLNQVQMTKVGTEYNYSCGPSSTLGTYIVNGIGDVDGEVAIWAYDYTVTTTGSGSGNTIPLFLLLGGFLIFIAAAYFKNEYIGILSGFLFIISGIYMMIFGLGMFADLYTRAISYVSLGIGLMICFISIIEMFYTDLGIVGGGEHDGPL